MPGPGRWKLWQLAALVAGSSLFMAAEHQSPGLMENFGFAAMICVPLLMVSFAWDGLVRRVLKLGRLAVGSIGSILIQAVLILIFLVAWFRWIVLVSRLFKLPWTP